MRLRLSGKLIRDYNSLVLLKRAGVNPRDIINFYCTFVRPVLEFYSPIFHHALPEYLISDIERVQKRELSIILPGSVC